MTHRCLKYTLISSQVRSVLGASKSVVVNITSKNLIVIISVLLMRNVGLSKVKVTSLGSVGSEIQIQVWGLSRIGFLLYLNSLIIK